MPYPVESLPGVIGAAVREFHAYGKQPLALIASSALAAVSVASQGLTDVARDSVLIGPTSLNFMIIADSGERKSNVDKHFSEAMRDWEKRRAKEMHDEIIRSRSAHEAWATIHDGFKASLKSAARSKPGKCGELRQQLEDHALIEPKVLVEARVLYEDVNPQSLAFMLATGHPSAALWSDEGGMVTGSHGMGNDSFLGFIAALNRLWDGGEIRHDRKQAQSVHVQGRRLTVGLMMQPMVIRELLQRGAGLSRGSGFMARFLVCAPKSTMGERPYSPPAKELPRLADFKRRLTALLDSDLPLDDQGRLSPPVLRLSDGAFSVWRDFHDDTESMLGPLGEMHAVRDFAAKSAENAVRIAACLHTFEAAHGSISADTMRRASVIARWYLNETLRVMDLMDEPQEFSDARRLDEWLAKNGNCSTRDARQHGPVRSKERWPAAVKVLTEMGRARIEEEGKRRLLVRNPALGASVSGPVALPVVAGRTAGDRIDMPVATVATVSVAESPNAGFVEVEL